MNQIPRLGLLKLALIGAVALNISGCEKPKDSPGSLPGAKGGKTSRTSHGEPGEESHLSPRPERPRHPEGEVKLDAQAKDKSSIAHLIENDKDGLLANLENLAPGIDRDDYIENVLKVLGDSPNLASKEVTLEILNKIDKSAYPEDKVSFFGRDLNHIVQNIGPAEAAKILQGFEYAPLRHGVANGIGAALAQQKPLNCQSVGNLVADLPPKDRTNVLSAFGSKVDPQSAPELTTLINNLKFSDADKSVVVDAVINSSREIPAADILENVEKVEPAYRDKLFKDGFNRLYDQNSKSATEFLKANKSKFPPELYKLGVKILVQRLEAVGDHPTADSWKGELK
ncbi:hypothetical protein [Haloferula sp. BvORR071]|uniref:hypothetical protein n=1 Tax=Haloferula sp. BvORR071 TaxID=1396141 RepID=UPI002240FABA|nr:hypothetical protein [Haloferula sp. BvORR071]